VLFDILGTVLENRGIKDVERFLKPSASDIIHYSKLNNIDKAVGMFEKHKGDTSEFTVLVDSDP
jgi:single-stranded-DNA-specific exonuclease